MTTAPINITPALRGQLARLGWSQLGQALVAVFLAAILVRYSDAAESVAWIAGGGILLTLTNLVFGRGKMESWRGALAGLVVLIGLGIVYGDTAGHSALIGCLILECGLHIIAGMYVLAFPEEAVAAAKARGGSR